MKPKKTLGFFLTSLLLGLTCQAFCQLDSLVELKLVFAGDIMGHDSQIEAAQIKKDSLYDYSKCFAYVSPILKEKDLAIGNLELTLPGEPPYQGYPQFRSPDELALALRYSGFNVLVTANNHSNDAGPQGLRSTLETLDNYHFHHTGTFRNPFEREAYYPLLIYRNQFKIAILNYTYGTNGIPTKSPTIVNRIDTSLIRKDMRQAEQLNPDFTIVILHWGKEYQTIENAKQKALATKLIQWGADLIIGSHPHVVQPIREERIHDKKDRVRSALVVYSLGNFISGQTKKYTNGGLLFEATLQKNINSGQTILAKHHYIPCYRYRSRDSTGKRQFAVLPIMPYLEQSPRNLTLSETHRNAMQAYRKHVMDVMVGSDGKERKFTSTEWSGMLENGTTK